MPSVDIRKRGPELRSQCPHFAKSKCQHVIHESSSEMATNNYNMSIACQEVISLTIIRTKVRVCNKVSIFVAIGSAVYITEVKTFENPFEQVFIKCPFLSMATLSKFGSFWSINTRQLEVKANWTEQNTLIQMGFSIGSVKSCDVVSASVKGQPCEGGNLGEASDISGATLRCSRINVVKLRSCVSYR
ncbi:PREDICTED: uncharacterized protein LOC105562827 [Vollenhovia emeryi]|uniref:uncharacterized protein LOC105562827 n=1 Tax=Vollenhovia emeryi TaxID=411798 RepID=UPI0005F3644D|nr:PREDICTED: uncharacterized protein LOC105562827 [Vollenhovia emeryi]